MSAKAIWKGSLSFGLVTVPVKAYKATDDPGSDTAMHEYHTCGDPAKRKLHCFKCAKDIDAAEVVSGVLMPDKSVLILSKEELDSIRPESSDNIALESFVSFETIDPVFIRSTYYLSGDGGAATEPYALLMAAMDAEGLAGQGQWTVYGREQNIIVRPLGGGLAVHLMRTVNEVRAQDQLPGYQAVGSVTLNPAMFKLAKTLITNAVEPFDQTEYEDSYAADFKALVAAKVAGTAPVTKAGKPAPVASDLMSQLTATMAGVAKRAKVAKPSVGAGPKSTKGVKKGKKIA